MAHGGRNSSWWNVQTENVLASVPMTTTKQVHPKDIPFTRPKSTESSAIKVSAQQLRDNYSRISCAGVTVTSLPASLNSAFSCDLRSAPVETRPPAAVALSCRHTLPCKRTHKQNWEAHAPKQKIGSNVRGLFWYDLWDEAVKLVTPYNPTWQHHLYLPLIH